MFISDDATVQPQRLGVFNLGAVFAECCLNNLETGSAVVKGAFSTDRCRINYPVVLFVENDD